MNKEHAQCSARWKWSYGEPPKRSTKKPPTAQAHSNKIEDSSAWRQKTTKREDTNFRLGSRDTMISNGANPFRPGSSYTEDICMQDKFLRPGAE